METVIVQKFLYEIKHDGWTFTTNKIGGVIQKLENEDAHNHVYDNIRYADVFQRNLDDYLVDNLHTCMVMCQQDKRWGKSALFKKKAKGR